MVSKFKINIIQNKRYIFLYLQLLIGITIQNEISLKFNKTEGTEIISHSYYSSISEVLVNEKSGNIEHYQNLLTDNINEITIKFNEHLKSCEYMFSNLNGILYVDFSKFFSSDVRSVKYMFRDCKSLQYLNFDNFDTSSVTNMYYMFYGCIELISLNLNHFITSSVTNMGYMFHYCLKLETLEISNFDTSSVEYMGYMFSYCQSLSSINVNNLNTSSVTNMEYMFQFCYSIVSLNLDNFNTVSVTNLRGLFNSCLQLESINLNNFDTSSVTDMSYMFSYCTSLTSVYLDNFNTESVLDMRYMFNGCNELISINLDNFNTDSVTDTRRMFYECYSLVSLNLTNFDFKYSNIDLMFEGVNIEMKYCIDEAKSYLFLDLLKNFEKNCKYVCIASNSKTYITETNICANKCSKNEYYLYEYDYNCYETCPNDTLLIENTHLCKRIEEAKSTENKNSKNPTIKIIVIIIIIIIIIVAVIIIIYCYICRGVLISIIFTTMDQQFNFSVLCRNNSIVNDIVNEKLYKQYPEYSTTNNYFLCNGKLVNLSRTFRENGIIDGNTIILYKSEDY